jgi:hypothetical protein
MKAAALASFSVVVLMLAACGGGSKPSTTGASTSSVPQLRSVEQLRAAFNAHASMPRLVVLLSPT